MLTQPTQITSLDLMGNMVGGLASRFTCPFTSSNSLNTLRIFVHPCHEWNYFLSLFEQSTKPSMPLHTLSIVFARYGKLFHNHISPPLVGWLGFDLSNPPFLNLHTLDIYADTGDHALPVCHSLFSWLAATLNKLSPQNRQFESLIVYL
ncbi:hypothetical protein APHAL10511_005682 [Amanita phalloides]|nr:hypothetical protein APHAL10511_005682 [Amanita phalloides]